MRAVATRGNDRPFVAWGLQIGPEATVATVAVETDAAGAFNAETLHGSQANRRHDGKLGRSRRLLRSAHAPRGRGRVGGGPRRGAQGLLRAPLRAAVRLAVFRQSRGADIARHVPSDEALAVRRARGGRG